ncbi:MAG: hypothetical protein COU90_00485 [Candidatus Ryanbacteria bacterium CG10_big_fil_rev_8_21_14_0_10_43_42]|uniref:ATP-grasp domain-containing protein n=1 Tax=Candidatus Ryanbacteria bacterium CG10_big_fil_rev_8_21_14_0_10_43_42 TaxID=1974864 RepID=A0A2M8KXW7_9BACT|nr:MAG: hypothetical protein COU90_00485 [Candidatus Ryanbacteria bacterium CG10_big_fil_rev_8_21_14_0_10_43_42]
MDKTRFLAWQKYIHNLGDVLKNMQEKTIIAVGIEPYNRIIPALFLDNYAIYCVKDSVDLDMLRKHAKIFCLEEHHPRIAAKVHALGYLVNNYIFQGFLKSWKKPYRLMINLATRRTAETLDKLGIDWIGNTPKNYEGTQLKGEFRDLIKQLKLPTMPEWRMSREEFLKLSYDDLHGKWQTSVVVQRADLEVSGNLGTFFLHTKDDWHMCRDILSGDNRFNEILISPFIEGFAPSMLGCVTARGVLTSTLQLQLIDVPESLHGSAATGTFLGNDWIFHSWPDETVKTAQHIVEEIGLYLSRKGYKGVFGIDFIYNKETHDLYPIECNPRFTGAFPMHSQMLMMQGVPPMEFFHIAAHLGIDVQFDFEKVNAAIKQRLPLSHIALVPHGIQKMTLPLQTGIYRYNHETSELTYIRAGIFMEDIKNDGEFLIVDSVPRFGSSIAQGVPRIFKLVFRKGIATSSMGVVPEVGIILAKLSSALRKNQPQKSDLAEMAEIDIEKELR